MHCIGIDLGTCLSSVAIMQNGKPMALRIDTASSSLIGDSYSIPSSIFIEEEGRILLGQAADNNRKKNSLRYRKEFKRDLGTDEPYHIGDMELFPEDLYKEFFKYFKSKAEERLGGAVEKVVVSNPANFAGHKKELIKKAALFAGFTSVELIDEPTAAAVYYSSKEKIENGEKLLVYDLGGGTFDVSLIEKEGNSFKALTPPLGIGRCGGVDFQKVIYDDIKDTFSNEIAPILSKRDKLAKVISVMLEEESIKLKHQLSTANSAEASIVLPTGDFLEYKITRETFERKIQEYINATCSKVEEIVKNAGLKMSNIDRVLLVGGSTRVPIVEEMVKKVTEKTVSKDADTELVVCYGAALYGNMNIEISLQGKSKLEKTKAIKDLLVVFNKIKVRNANKRKKKDRQRFKQTIKTQNDKSYENITTIKDEQVLMKAVRKDTNQFSMRIEDTFPIEGRGVVVTGIVSGKVKVGDYINVFDKDRDLIILETVITGIEMNRKLIEYASTGDNVGILLRLLGKSDIRKGQIIVKF